MAAKERVIELEKKIFDLELQLEHKNQLLAEKDLECDHKLKDLVSCESIIPKDNLLFFT